MLPLAANITPDELRNPPEKLKGIWTHAVGADGQKPDLWSVDRFLGLDSKPDVAPEIDVVILTDRHPAPGQHLRHSKVGGRRYSGKIGTKSWNKRLAECIEVHPIRTPDIRLL
jgi:hypothetical protein